MIRFYIGYTSIFDGSRKYDAAQIAKAVKQAGGSNVRLAHQFGWSNQPKVVCFNASSDRAATGIATLASDLIFPKNRSSLIHLIAYKKDW